MSLYIILLTVQFYGLTLMSITAASYLPPTAEQQVPKPTRSDVINNLQTASPIKPSTKQEISTPPLSTPETSLLTTPEQLSYRSLEQTRSPLTSSDISLFTSLEHSISQKTSLKPMSYLRRVPITTPMISPGTSSVTALTEHSTTPTTPTKSLAFAKRHLITTPLTPVELSPFTTLEHSISSSFQPLSFTSQELISIQPTPCQTSPLSMIEKSVNLMTSAQATTTSLMSSLLPTTTHLMTSLHPTTTPLMTSLQPKTTPLMSSLQPTTTPFMTSLQSTTTPLMSSLQPTTTPLMTSLQSITTPLMRSLQSTTTPPMTSLQSTTTPLMTSLRSTTTHLITSLQSTTTPLRTSLQSTTTSLIQDECSSVCLASHHHMVCYAGLPCSIPVNINTLSLSYNELYEGRKQLPINIPGSEYVTKMYLYDWRYYRYDRDSFDTQYADFTSRGLYCFMDNLFPAVHTIYIPIDHPRFVHCSWPSVTDIFLKLRGPLDQKDMEVFPPGSFRNLKRLFLYKSDVIKNDYAWIHLEINIEFLQNLFPNLEILNFQYITSSTITLKDNGYCRKKYFFRSVYFSTFFSYDFNIIDETRCEYESIEFNYTSAIRRIPTKPGYNIHPLHIIGFKMVVFHDVDSHVFYRRWEGQYPNRKFGVEILFSYDSRLLVSANKIKIFKFHSQQNDLIKYLFKIMNIANTSHIDKLDLSSFKITYLSFTSFESKQVPYWVQAYLLNNIQYVSLANNELGLMADQHKENWSRIFHNFPLLSQLDLSTNGISYLPEDIFTFNLNLTNIILAGNTLKYIPFKVFRELNYLNVLDISHNNIKLTNIDVRQGLALLALLNNKFELNISGNVLECTCIDLDTYTWISGSRKSGHLHFNDSTCLTADNVPLELNDVEKYCSHQKLLQIIPYSTGIPGGIITLMAITVILVWRLRARQRKIAKYLNDMKQMRSKKEYVLFLSHCSRDIDLVYKEILPNIQRHLVDRTHIDREYICTRDLHFKPGFKIIQEAIRCIDLCSVVVFVISKAFVDSPFCRMEVKETLDRAKPVILIMKDKIELHKLPRIIKNLFYKNVRFHLVKFNHGYQVTPSWIRLVDAILELEANEERDIETLELLREEKKINKIHDNEIEMKELRERDNK